MRPLRKRSRATWLLAALLLISSTTPAWAENEGQADLDEATALKFNAGSMADLERVVELCESGIEKGLDGESKRLATSLLTATLFQHGSRFAQALFDPNERTQRPAMLKRFALRDLYKVLEYDDSQPQVHMMVARLEAIPTSQNGVRPEAYEKGKASADAAIELLEKEGNKPMLSKALILRAGYQRGAEQAADISRAIEVDPENTDAWRLRGKSRLVEGEFLAAQGKLDEAKVAREKAISDFTTLLEMDPNDADALQALAELLGRLENFDEAIAKANQAIEQKPGSSNLFRMRARLFRLTKQYDKGIQDLNRAIDISPDSFLAFLERSHVNFDKGDKTAAARDFGRARELEPNMQAIILQGITIRSEGSSDKAVAELKKIIEIDDLNSEQDDRRPDPAYRLQLGVTHQVAQNLAGTIETLTDCLDRMDDKTNSGAKHLALRTRADAYLGIGEHAKAIDDYERATVTNPKDGDVLNNLAWVLSTTPKDELRNGLRAIELATKACEATNYGQAHILSTLAAAYAEAGKWDEAVEWSTKAVEMRSRPETQEQLEGELKSYKEKKPWRELQVETETQEEPKTQEDPAEQEDQETQEEPEAVGAAN